jgi:hypothetical protein
LITLRPSDARGHADAALDAATLHGPQALQYPIAPGRCAYVHVVRGSVHLNAATPVSA